MNSEVFKSDIDEDIAIRRSNLTSIKTLSTRYPFTDSDKDVWRRCSFPIIYAEWEGFFVNAMTLYIREVNRTGLSIDQLNDRYVVNVVEKKFKQLKEYPKDTNKKAKFLNNLKDYVRNTGQIQMPTEINTESNLGFKVTNAILDLYCIEQIEDHIDHDATSYKDEMEKFLLDKRNGLAHGDPSVTVTPTDIHNAIQLVDRLMETVKENLAKGLEDEVFMK